MPPDAIFYRYNFDFGWGSAPGLASKNNSALPDRRAGFKRAYFKVEERNGKGKKKEERKGQREENVDCQRTTCCLKVCIINEVLILNSVHRVPWKRNHIFSTTTLASLLVDFYNSCTSLTKNEYSIMLLIYLLNCLMTSKLWHFAHQDSLTLVHMLKVAIFSLKINFNTYFFFQLLLGRLMPLTSSHQNVAETKQRCFLATSLA